MKHSRIALGAVFAFGMLATASADDFAPPPWRLTDPSCTVQEWEFDTSSISLAPDGSTWGSNGGGYVNPFGTPLLNSSTGSWYTNLNGQNGVWEILPGQELDFTIPNDGPGVGTKQMWIQLTTLAPGAIFLPDVNIAAPGYSSPATLVNAGFNSYGWIYSTWSVTMNTCPQYETIQLFNSTTQSLDVTEMVTDTICRTTTPEPTTLAVLGVGLAGLAAKRRKARRLRQK